LKLLNLVLNSLKYLNPVGYCIQGIEFTGLFLKGTSLNKTLAFIGDYILLYFALVESVGLEKVLSSNDSGNVTDKLSITSALKMETVCFPKSCELLLPRRQNLVSIKGQI